METSEDAFLGGRLRIRQPVKGYRAGADPVFLAAAVNAAAGETVLDLGCGVGVAMLCLKSRVPEVEVAGVELQPELADLARRNLAANDMTGEVITADAGDLPATLRARSFDHVLTNPPFFDAAKVRPSEEESRDTGRRIQMSMRSWIDIALRRIRPGGTLTLVNRIEQLPICLSALDGRAGAIRLLPLAPRSGRPAKLFLLSAQKEARAPMSLLAPLTLHEGAEHVNDGDNYSEIARSVLREGQALRL